MKKRTLLSLILTFTIVFSACAPAAAPASSPSPAPIPTPQATMPALPTTTPLASADGTHTIEEKTVYFPDGSDASSAKLTLKYSLPSFIGEGESSLAMNDAMRLFSEELFERVNDEYMPIATESDDKAMVEVLSQVTLSRGYTNVLFTERTTFGDTEKEAFSTIVFDKEGDECSLGSISSLAGAQELIAQLVLNRMDQERDKYFALPLEAVVELVDLYNGFYVTDGGFIVSFAPGTIAAQSEGQVFFELNAQELYPAFVGDTLSYESYQMLLPVINSIADVCAETFESFDGTPSQAVVTAVIKDMINAMPYPPKTPYGVKDDYITCPKAELENLYNAYFYSSFPGVLKDDMPLDHDVYLVPMDSAVSDDYIVSLTDAVARNDTLTLTGDILSMESPVAKEITGITVELIVDDKVPMGYRIASFMVTR